MKIFGIPELLPTVQTTREGNEKLGVMEKGHLHSCSKERSQDVR